MTASQPGYGDLPATIAPTHAPVTAAPVIDVSAPG